MLIITKRNDITSRIINSLPLKEILNFFNKKTTTINKKEQNKLMIVVKLSVFI